jgi:transposase-like protein
MDRKDKPSHQKAPEHVKHLAAVAQVRQEEALNPDHVIKLHYGFETQKKLWNEASERDRNAIVYGMVLYDGAIAAGGRDIARFFGIDKKELEPYKPTFEMAKVALKLKIQHNQISMGLQREDLPMLKFFLGKQFAEQVQEPAHEGVGDLRATPPQIIINTAEGANADVRAELDAAVTAAMAMTKAKVA